MEFPPDHDSRRYPIWDKSPEYFFYVGPVKEQHKRIIHMAFDLQDHQMVSVAVTGGKDKAGNPGALPAGGTFTWASSDETVVVVQNVSADTASAEVVAVGPLGSATVTVTGDSLTGTLDVTVVAGPPVALDLTPGTPVDKP